MSFHSFGECMLSLDDPCKMYIYPSMVWVLFSWVFFLISLSLIMICSTFQSCLDIEFITFNIAIEFIRWWWYFFHNCSDKSIASWIWYNWLKWYLSYRTSRPEYKVQIHCQKPYLQWRMWIMKYSACFVIEPSFTLLAKVLLIWPVVTVLLYLIGLTTWTYYTVIPLNLSK